MFNFDLLKGGKMLNLVAQCLIGYVLFFPLSGKRLMFTFLVVVSSVQKPNEQRVRADGFLFLFGCVLQRIQVVNLVLVHYVAKFLERTVELDWGCTQLFTLVSSQWLFCWVKFKLSVSAVKQWKEFLDYNYTIGFIFHEDAKMHNRAAKNRYTI